MSSQIIDKFKQLDAYAKTLEDFRVKTATGAAITIAGGVIMILLFLSELNTYMSPNISEELFVDTSRGHKLRINLDIIVPTISCNYLVLDAMDSSGEQHLQMDHNIHKRRLDLNGKPIEEPKKEEISTASSSKVNNSEVAVVTCGSCYGAAFNESQCCNTCEDVREAYRLRRWAMPDLSTIEQCKNDESVEKTNLALKEGCQIYGYMEVNRIFFIYDSKNEKLKSNKYNYNNVCFGFKMWTYIIIKRGWWKFSYSSRQKVSPLIIVHVHDVQPYSSSVFNTTHVIQHLSFGTDIQSANTAPLNGVKGVALEGATMFQYYLKIVPTMYVKLDKTVLHTNQFSVTRHQKSVSNINSESGMPGAFFTYELSPLMVKYTEKDRSIGHFVTNICAIIGGVFTVAGIFDALLYHSINAFESKTLLGKTG